MNEEIKRQLINFIGKRAEHHRTNRDRYKSTCDMKSYHDGKLRECLDLIEIVREGDFTSA